MLLCEACHKLAKCDRQHTPLTGEDLCERCDTIAVVVDCENYDFSWEPNPYADG